MFATQGVGTPLTVQLPSFGSLVLVPQDSPWFRYARHVPGHEPA
ncbi:hypothetical protein AKJ09_06750 [Labilithrix luteola]|uniref:Uncharacterized protein n=1 Tax=Labilithrix luteola TaxID=1391654 RepID=A0A0K1Q374_9BACT|nr:hypothetical protein AKJ09_06750 [Labilithrix luteola]